MQNDIQSYNTRQQRTREIRHFFIPTAEEVVLYLVVAFLLLSLIELGDIWDYFNQTVIGIKGGFTSILSQNTAVLDKFVKILNEGTVLQFLFWFIFVAIFYAFFWFLKTIVLNFRNDMVIGKYYIQGEDAKTKFFHSAVRRRVMFVLAVILMSVFLFKGVWAVISLAGLFYQSLLPNFQVPQSLFISGAAVVLTAILVHVLIVLSRVIAVAWRYITPF